MRESSERERRIIAIRVIVTIIDTGHPRVEKNENSPVSTAQTSEEPQIAARRSDSPAIGRAQRTLANGLHDRGRRRIVGMARAQDFWTTTCDEAVIHRSKPNIVRRVVQQPPVSSIIHQRGRQ